MNCAGHKFFTGTAFTMDQNRAGRGSDSADCLLEFVDRRAGANDIVERVTGRSVATQGKVLLAQHQLFQGAAESQLDFIDQAGVLANVVGGSACLYGLDGGLIVIHGRDEDDCGIRRNAMGVAEHFDAIDVRHLDVGDDDIVERAIDLVFCRLSRLHGFHAVAVAAQGDIEHFANRAFVVADENVSHGTCLRPRRQISQ